jgi:ComF family protein
MATLRQRLRPIHTLSRQTLDLLAPPVIETSASGALDWKPDAREHYCGRCGITLGTAHARPETNGPGCTRCAHRKPTGDRLVRLSNYEPPVSDWIRAMKFRNRFVWCDWLGQHLGETLAHLKPHETSSTWVTSVPMPWRRRWWRGYNQAERIGRALATRRGIRYADLLYRTRCPAPQTQVAASYRAANVSASFVAEHVDLTGIHIVLVDDVLTSGSTMRGCVRVLRERGVAEITVAVVAVADPKMRDAEA